MPKAIGLRYDKNLDWHFCYRYNRRKNATNEWSAWTLNFLKMQNKTLPILITTAFSSCEHFEEFFKMQNVMTF